MSRLSLRKSKLVQPSKLSTTSWSLTKILKLVDWIKTLDKVKTLNALGPLRLWQCFIAYHHSILLPFVFLVIFTKVDFLIIIYSHDWTCEAKSQSRLNYLYSYVYSITFYYGWYCLKSQYQSWFPRLLMSCPRTVQWFPENWTSRQISHCWFQQFPGILLSHQSSSCTCSA